MFCWSIKATINFPGSIKERDKYLQEIPSEFPYLFGKQHYNRLICGTKVYILSGKFKIFLGQ